MTDSRQINEKADDIATECRNYVHEGLISADNKPFIPCSKVMVSIRRSRITKNLKQEIRKAVHEGNMKQFLMKKYGWGIEDFQPIDWPSHAACLKHKPYIYITAIMKLIHQWQPTMQKIPCYNRNNQRDTCLLCGKIKTQHHYMYCQEDQYKLARKN